MIQRIKCLFGFHKISDFDALFLFIGGDVTLYRSKCSCCKKMVTWV